MERVYEIRDTARRLVAEHVRIDATDGTKRMFWRRPGCDPRDGLAGLSTRDLPLYGAEDIGRIQWGQSVVICEGERATEAIWSLRHPALGTVTGASSTPGEDALSPLLPFDVVLWPDFDEAGEQHMARIAAEIIRLGDGQCRRLTWAGATDKGDDAADFVTRGGTRVALDLMIQAATPWKLVENERRQSGRPTYETRFNELQIDQARSQLATVVEEALGPPARTMGRSLFWCCPFHSERTPSFKVDKAEPFYRCFGCHARGDVFTFLREMEGRGFRDALLELAPPPPIRGVPVVRASYGIA